MRRIHREPGCGAGGLALNKSAGKAATSLGTCRRFSCRSFTDSCGPYTQQVASRQIWVVGILRLRFRPLSRTKTSLRMTTVWVSGTEAWGFPLFEACGLLLNCPCPCKFGKSCHSLDVRGMSDLGLPEGRMTRFLQSALWAAVAATAMFPVLPAHAQKPRQRAELVYVANQSADDVSAYSIRPGGALLAIAGSPFAAGSSPNSVAVVPSGRFVYVADVIPGGISGFSVSEVGAITPIPGSPFPAATGTVFVTSDPSGRFLYALNCGSDCSSSGTGDIEAFTIDQQTGVLTEVAGSPSRRGIIPTR